MAKIEWNQVKMSDIQQNVLIGGREGTSAADALDARSAVYQAGKSHSAFLQGAFLARPHEDDQTQERRERVQYDPAGSASPAAERQRRDRAAEFVPKDRISFSQACANMI